MDLNFTQSIELSQYSLRTTPSAGSTTITISASSLANRIDVNASREIIDGIAQSSIDIPRHHQYDWIFLFVIIFIIAGGLGNILVCLAVALDRKLQNVTNYFLLSLAVADLLVSLFVMPLGAIPGFLGYWPFGFTWCNIYVTCDVLACSSSILHMCFISIGRYMGIRNPLKSRHHSTKRLAGVKIALAWLMAMMVSSSITILGLINKSNIMPGPYTCVINNRAFFVFGSLVAFYIPMLMMVSTYALTIQLLKKKARFAAEHPESEYFRRLGRFAIRSQDNHIDCVEAHESNGKNNFYNDVRRFRTSKIISRTKSENRLQTDGQGLSYWRSQFDGSNNYERDASGQCSCDDNTPQSERISCGFGRCRLRTLKSTVNTVAPPILNLRFLHNRTKGRNLSSNAFTAEKKATKVLGLVFFTFVLCWAPFFILNIVFAVCPKCKVPEHITDTCLWLGYVSSTINPILYTIFNRTFRAAFIRLLKCNCEKSGRPPRYRSVTEGRGTASLCAPSALPLAISFQGAPLLTPSTTNATPLSDFHGSFAITDDEC
ncbi:unnamed protein product [Hermetia illucens]|uniref:G-protein coupled receptors family 1 profile domain-containing protein n=1 Tax=Hermetia illucens TaxID=343691 RepID=A0A7R8V6S1_HERIL|nr:5-hydroxytryptamine receptor 2C isoform X2 [Hermetia illucens]CAD7093027.1 unnamed protein product [Hermetia illucens]